MEKKHPTEYYFAKYPIRRILANQLITLDSDVLSTLSRLQILVWSNPTGIRGNGCVYTEAGQKADKEWVLSTLARLGGMDRSSLRRCLTQLKVADEVSFDKGRPCLKHWRRDRDREPTKQAQMKKQLRDRDLVSAVVEILPMFLKSPEARTLDSLCGWLGWKLSKDPKSTIQRVVDLLIDDGVVCVGDDGVFSVSGGALHSPPSAALPPPPIGTIEQKTIDLDPPETSPADYREPIAKEDNYVIPIDSIGDSPREGSASPGTESSKEGGGRAAEGDIRPASITAPPTSDVVRESGSSARGVFPNQKQTRRSGHGFGYSRKWSEGRSPGWVTGAHPHPRRSKWELREFKEEGLWDCDLIDGMLFLGPDGYPRSEQYPWGQEGVFKGLLRSLNKAAGGVGAPDESIRHVFREFIEESLNQKKPFDRDAALLKNKLNELLKTFQANQQER